MTPLRVAVVGAGHLGRIHAKLLAQVEDARLVAVVDPYEPARQNAEAMFGVPTFACHREILDRIDAAIIASPSDLHAQTATDLLIADKHVFVEKPITVEPADADRLVQLAAARRRTLQVGHVERFNPAWTAASEVTAGAKYIEAVRASRFPGRCLDVGVVMDLMIHDIDLVLAATGQKPHRVEAAGLSLFGQHEDIAQATLRFPGGCIAQLTASRLSYHAERKMQVWSEAGFASLDFAGRCATVIHPHDAVYDRSLDAAQLSPEMRDELREHMFDKYLVKETITPEPADQITAELQDFAAAIRTGGKPRVDGAAGLAALDVAQQVLDAMQRHAWDGERGDRVGPKVEPLPHVLPGPHFLRRAATHDSVGPISPADQRHADE